MNVLPSLKPIMVWVMVAAASVLMFASQPMASSQLPFTYDFQEDQTIIFNNIGSLNKMEIEFDYAIEPFGRTSSPQLTSSTPGMIDSASSDGRTLTVYFRNIASDSFLDYTCEFSGTCEQELIIPAGSLTQGNPPLPVEDYTIPFQMSDLLPGFKTIFIDSSEAVVNNHVLAANSPREVDIHIPNIYMTAISTIHRYEGIESSARLRPLTNIDIEADENVSRIDLRFGAGNNQYDRQLSRTNVGGFNGFTTGQAGLEADLIDETNSNLNPEQFRANEIRLDAYDSHGRYLETRSFRLSVRDKDADFIVDDYVGDIPSHFGETYSLYDLMENPELLDEVVSLVPVSELNRLGVTYTNRLNTRQVGNYEELLRALDNQNVTTITLTSDITPPPGAPPLTVNRNLTLFGDGHNLAVREIRAGNGSRSREIAFRDLTLNHASSSSDLIVDVGDTGSMILDGVDVSGGVDIRSGGTESVHLHDLSAGYADLTSQSPVRVVVSGDTSFEANDHRGLYVQSSADHQIELYSDQVRVIAGDGGRIRDLYVYGEDTFIRYENGGSIEHIHGNGTGDLIFDESQTGTFSVTDSRNNWSDGRVLRIEEVTLNNNTTIFFGQANISWTAGDLQGGRLNMDWNKENSFLRLRGADGSLPDRGNYYVTFEGISDDGNRLNYRVELQITVN